MAGHASGSDAAQRLSGPGLGSLVQPPQCEAIERPYESALVRLAPAQARAFRLLSVADGPDFTVVEAAVVLDVPVADAATLVESLVDIHLVEPRGAESYFYHAPLRTFARSHAHAEDGPEAVENALTRLLRWRARRSIGALLST